MTFAVLLDSEVLCNPRGQPTDLHVSLKVRRWAGGCPCGFAVPMFLRAPVLCHMAWGGPSALESGAASRALSLTLHFSGAESISKTQQTLGWTPFPLREGVDSWQAPILASYQGQSTFVKTTPEHHPEIQQNPFYLGQFLVTVNAGF